MPTQEFVLNHRRMHLFRGLMAAGAISLFIFATICWLFNSWNTLATVITMFNSTCLIVLVIDAAVLVWTGHTFDPPATDDEIREAYQMGLTRSSFLQNHEKWKQEQAAERAEVERATLARMAAEEAARQERQCRIQRRLDRLGLSEAVSSVTLDRLSRSSSEAVEQHFRLLRELSAIISDRANIGNNDVISEIVRLFAEGQIDEARHLVGMERLRTTIRRSAATAGVCVDDLLARNDFGGAEARMRQARTIEERRRELDALQLRVSQLPQHRQPAPRDLLVAAEAAVAGTDREYRQAIHPLRRELEG